MAKRKKDTQNRTFIFLLFTLILTGILLIVGIKTNSLPVDILEKKSPRKSQFFPLAKEFVTVLKQYKIATGKTQVDKNNLRIFIPPAIHPAAVFASFSQLIMQKGGTIHSGSQTAADGTARLEFSFKSKQIWRIEFLVDRQNPAGPKIAIVIDDFGYKNSAIIQQLIEFPYPITYSVIPGLPKSKAIAQTLFQRHKTIFIHLPMEPMQGKVESDGFTLFTTLKEKDIRERVKKAIAEVPHAVGLNNHMGSKATADSATMAVALDEIKKAKLLFLDSRTSQNSVAFPFAKKMKIPAFLNNAFIDAVDDETEIRKKMERLAQQAKKEGMAIGIGHPRAKTVAVLQEIVPNLVRQGFVFIALKK